MAGKIKKIWGEVIHDSRGDETLQVNLETDSGKTVSSAVPAGASKSSFEAKPVDPNQSVKVIEQLQGKFAGFSVIDQAAFDQALIKEDGTPDKSKLGANTILGLSMCVCRAAAVEQGIELYQYIGNMVGRKTFKLPIPMMNIINGGKHADNNLEIQEFMIIPAGIEGYHNQLSAGKMIFSTLGDLLKASTPFIPIGDEGGYAPMLDTNEMAIGYIMEAIKQCDYQPGKEVSLGLDIAASSVPDTFDMREGRYINFLDEFPLISFEDPYPEDDWPRWSSFMKKINDWNVNQKTILLVGDDLYATNKERLERGIAEKASNAILIKVNQIGSISETIDCIETAHRAGFITVVSHRSGETLDDFIADLAVGSGSQFIKAGAPNDSHPERIVKYRRLLNIEKQLTVPDAQ